jgi:hypothetical protein
VTEFIVPCVEGIQYDGTNYAEVIAAIPPEKITDNELDFSEVAEGIRCRYNDAGPQEYVLPPGDWLTWISSQWGAPVPLPGSAIGTSRFLLSSPPA